MDMHYNGNDGLTPSEKKRRDELLEQYRQENARYVLNPGTPRPWPKDGFINDYD